MGRLLCSRKYICIFLVQGARYGNGVGFYGIPNIIVEPTKNINTFRRTSSKDNTDELGNPSSWIMALQLSNVKY